MPDIELMTMERDLAHARYSISNDSLQLVAKEAEIDQMHANINANRDRCAQLEQSIAERKELTNV